MKLTEAPDSAGDVLAFAVAGQRYGVPLRRVVEVLRAVAVAEMPMTPPAIEGIINLRGTIVPVLNIRARFGLPDKALEPPDRMVVVRSNRRHAILRVDSIIGIMSVGAGAFDGGKAATSEHIKGAVKLPDGLLLIYDIDTFLSQADAEMFDLGLTEEVEK